MLENAVAVVGLVDPPTRLAILPSLREAESYIETLPHSEDGRYYLDWPCYGLSKLDD